MSAGARARAARRSAQTGRRPRSLRLPGRRPWAKWAVVALAAVAIVIAAGYLWLRDSSLVSVHKVRVVGVSGPETSQIRTALVTAAHNMTTLDVSVSQLRTAVEPYPDVKNLQVSTQFPHGMTIRVVEQVPVAVVSEAGQRVDVAGDGTLLHDVSPSSSLPMIALQVPPGGRRLTGYPLTEVQLLAAAPYQLLARIRGVSDEPAHGLAAELRNGPNIYFGSAGQFTAKWNAATAVLANSGSAGSDYVDVTDPNRPATGVGADVNAAGATASGTSSSSGAGAATTGSTTPSSGG